MKSPTMCFQIRANRASNGKMPIVVRFYANNKNKYVSTNFRVVENEWNPISQRTKSDPIVNRYLDSLSAKFNKAIAENMQARDLDHLAKVVMGMEQNEKPTLKGYVEQFVNTKVKKNDVIYKTLTRYIRVQSVLNDFLRFSNQSQVRLCDVNLSLINQWDTYLKSTPSSNGLVLEQNTRNKYHSITRTILNQAFNEGEIPVNPYANFKLKAKPTYREFLSDQELDLLMKNTMAIDKYEKVRLIYLFSCFTGLRFEDAQRLTKSNIKRSEDGSIYLSLISSKSSKQQELPLLDEAEFIMNEMVKKFGAELDIHNRILPKMSNQKFNDYLKDIAFRLGIEKQLTHHTARHTFATYLLNRGVSLSALQVLLGHSNIRETQVYTKITPGYLKQELKKGNKKYDTHRS